MKKVLAAVLAAAMSLGMASVAMAVEGGVELPVKPGSGTSLTGDYDYTIDENGVYVYLEDALNKSTISTPSNYRLYTYNAKEVKFFLPVRNNKDVTVRADVTDGKVGVNTKRATLSDGTQGYAITVKAKWGVKDFDVKGWTVELDVNDNIAKKHPTVYLKGEGAYSDTQPVYSGVPLTVCKSGHKDVDGTTGAIFDFSDLLDEKTRIRCKPGVDLIFKGNYDTKKENLEVRTGTIDEVKEFFGDEDVDYFDFIAAPKFASNVTVYINADKGTTPYTYNKDSGELEIFEDAKYKDELNAWVFTTKKLGTYIFAEEEHEGGNVKDEPTKEPVSEPTETPADKNNPGTGANDMVGAAAALAVVSLIAAGAVAFKKASK